MGNRPDRLRVQNCGHVVQVDRLGYYAGQPWTPDAPCPECAKTAGAHIALPPVEGKSSA